MEFRNRELAWNSSLGRHLLGQEPSLQDSFSLGSPSQSAPPSCGAGLSHVRVLDRVPSPHVSLQGSHSVHGDNSPSTTTRGDHLTINAWGRTLDRIFTSINIVEFRKSGIEIVLGRQLCISQFQPCTFPPPLPPKMNIKAWTTFVHLVLKPLMQRLRKNVNCSSVTWAENTF